MRRRALIAAAGGVAAVLVGGIAGGFVYDRVGSVTADEAGERVRSDVQTLVVELGLQRTDSGGDPVGEDCVIADAGGETLSNGPHRQHRITVHGNPPPGQAATGLAAMAEDVLRGLGYRIITSEVDFAEAPPPGVVIAAWGPDNAVEITLWPDPEAGTVGVVGRTRCLPR